MDPRTNVYAQLNLASEIINITNNCSDDGEYTTDQMQEMSELAFELASLVQSLDAWITKGGHIPDRWDNPTTN